jgi:hypothetical protein
MIRVPICLLILALSANPLSAQKFIRVDSPGEQKSYTLNLADKRLPALLSSSTATLPAWLILPGSEPEIQQRGSTVSARFQVGGAVAASEAYYHQLLASQGYEVQPARSTPKLAFVRGTREGRDISVHLDASMGAVRDVGGEIVNVRISAPAAPIQVPATAQLETVQYDDSTGRLTLRDKSTDAQYFLDRQSIHTLASGTPLGNPADSSTSTLTTWPSFVPVYPNGRVDRPLSKLAGKRPGLEFRLLTRDTPAQADAWYRAALARAGFVLQQESKSSSGGLNNFSLAAVDPSGTHAVKVRIGSSFLFPTMVCDKNDNNASPSSFTSFGNCKMSDPEKTAIDLTYIRLQ